MTDETAETSEPVPGPTPRERLESAAEGLVYSSEADHPFEYFELAGAAAEWPLDAVAFAALVGAPEDAPAEEWTLEHLLAAHLEPDPADEAAQALRPRYEALRDTLHELLREPRAFRVGEVEIRCYLVGATGDGDVAGLETTAVET
jgi:hypothetical protein